MDFPDGVARLVRRRAAKRAVEAAVVRPVEPMPVEDDPRPAPPADIQSSVTSPPSRPPLTVDPEFLSSLLSRSDGSNSLVLGPSGGSNETPVLGRLSRLAIDGFASSEPPLVSQHAPGVHPSIDFVTGLGSLMSVENPFGLDDDAPVEPEAPPDPALNSPGRFTMPVGGPGFAAGIQDPGRGDGSASAPRRHAPSQRTLDPQSVTRAPVIRRPQGPIVSRVSEGPVDAEPTHAPQATPGPQDKLPIGPQSSEHTASSPSSQTVERAPDTSSATVNQRLQPRDPGEASSPTTTPALDQARGVEVRAPARAIARPVGSKVVEAPPTEASRPLAPGTPLSPGLPGTVDTVTPSRTVSSSGASAPQAPAARQAATVSPPSTSDGVPPVGSTSLPLQVEPRASEPEADTARDHPAGRALEIGPPDGSSQQPSQPASSSDAVSRSEGITAPAAARAQSDGEPLGASSPERALKSPLPLSPAQSAPGGPAHIAQAAYGVSSADPAAGIAAVSRVIDAAPPVSPGRPDAHSPGPGSSADSGSDHAELPLAPPPATSEAADSFLAGQQFRSSRIDAGTPPEDTNEQRAIRRATVEALEPGAAAIDEPPASAAEARPRASDVASTFAGTPPGAALTREPGGQLRSSYPLAAGAPSLANIHPPSIDTATTLARSSARSVDEGSGFPTAGDSPASVEPRQSNPERDTELPVGPRQSPVPGVTLAESMGPLSRTVASAAAGQTLAGLALQASLAGSEPGSGLPLAVPGDAASSERLTAEVVERQSPSNSPVSASDGPHAALGAASGFNSALPLSPSLARAAIRRATEMPTARREPTLARPRVADATSALRLSQPGSPASTAPQHGDKADLPLALAPSVRVAGVPGPSPGQAPPAYRMAASALARAPGGMGGLGPSPATETNALPAIVSASETTEPAGAPGADSEAGAAPSPARAEEDINTIADRVWSIIRQKLRIERERQRGF